MAANVTAAWTGISNIGFLALVVALSVRSRKRGRAGEE